MPKPLMLTILDGWGVGDGSEGDAIARGQKPNYDQLLAEYPDTLLGASGEDVGLPEGQMGNSEVGHLNIGAGRIVYQEFTRISKAIKDGPFFQNEEFIKAMASVKENHSALHLMGLLSDGGVHSHISHLYALLEMAQKSGVQKVFVHAFLDGRDVPPVNAREYIDALEQKFTELGIGAIATVMGRYYAMDRDKRWERVEMAYNALCHGRGEKATLASGAVAHSYEKGNTDEFVLPTVIIKQDGTPVATVSDRDSIIFYNFRPDRARELTRAFVDEEFLGFDRGSSRPKTYFVCMTQYDKTIGAPIAFKPQVLSNTLGEYLSLKGLKQLRIAETEKYAHVTFFFNGGVEPPNEGEERVLIPSPKVATYDLKPEMSAYEVADAVIGEIDKDTYDVIVLNFANADMVGHTGVMEAAQKAVETVDACLGKVAKAVLTKGGAMLVTADHGNADQMVDKETGQPFTAHTLNRVPLILVSDKFKNAKLLPGRLEDIAPTMLYMLGLDQPAEMTGKCLINQI